MTTTRPPPQARTSAEVTLPRSCPPPGSFFASLPALFEYIGALLADALGYGYIDIRYSLPLALDRTPTDPHVTAARVEFARDLASDESATRRNVWSVTDHRVLPEITGTLKDAAVGCAVYVRSQDQLLRRGSEAWDVPFAEMVGCAPRSTSSSLPLTGPC